MSHRLRLGAALGCAGALSQILAFSTVVLFAQRTTAPQSASGKGTPRTRDGRPDLSGTWSFVSATPLERPEEFGDKAVLTDQEIAEIARRAAAQQATERQPPTGDTGAYNSFWTDAGAKRTDKRTSLISDPPNGRLPPVTPETRKRMVALMTAESNPNEPEDLTPWGRCITGFNAGPPILPSGYNNNVQIVQGRDTVLVFTEMVHEARFVPLDGRPHLPASLRQWQGDSRGRWEGDTLVIDTTNFRKDGTGNLPLLGAGVGGRLRTGVLTDENLHVTERLTRADANTLRYEVRVEDPTVWTRPWTAVVLMQKTDEGLYEYACHEGNYAIRNILTGARAMDVKRAGAERRR
jgi:hypothetical protein